MLFLAVFYVAYQLIPDLYYLARDDGIITLSHAKNLVDYGSIGINPSGERVEGFSAPVEFFLYGLIYSIYPIHYVTYGTLQALVGALLLGLLFVRFFPDHSWVGLGFSFLAAAFLATSSSFIEWHGSGMENAITHVLFLATLLVLYEMVRSGHINFLYVIPVFLATVSRVESAFHIGPLLILFSLYWWFCYRTLAAFCFSSVVFVLWIALHVWRYLYFGEILPNTANAQSISILGNLLRLFAGDRSFFTSSKYIATSILRVHGGFVLAVFLPLLFFVKYTRSRAFLFILLGSLIATAVINPFVFGRTRLDETRTTTHLAVVAVLFASLLVYWTRSRRLLIVTLPMILPAAVYVASYGIAGSGYQRRPPYNLCCETFPAEYPRQEFLSLKVQHSLMRPTVANPDLGSVSWHKEFNIVDLGLLGSRIIGKLDDITFADYLFDFAAPDFIELHGAWSEFYKDNILADSRFADLYEPVTAKWATCGLCRNSPVLEGIWVRRAIKAGALSEERKLVDQLSQAASLHPISEALNRCQAESANPVRCQYVLRSAYRYLPEFRSQGLQAEVISLFANTPTASYDQSLLGGFARGDWYREALAYLRFHSRGQRPDISTEVPLELRMKTNPTSMGAESH